MEAETPTLDDVTRDIASELIEPAQIRHIERIAAERFYAWLQREVRNPELANKAREFARTRCEQLGIGPDRFRILGENYIRFPPAIRCNRVKTENGSGRRAVCR